MDEADYSDFSCILEVVASDDTLVMLMNSYFDESYDDRLLCVAGYTFTSRKARLINEEWRKMLLHYQIPYFRMSACNSGNAPFDNLTESECIAVATRAIKLIGEYANFGVAVTVDQEAFNQIVGRRGFVSTPYEFCSWMCLVAANSNAEMAFPGQRMAFFFEAGFRHQNLANKMMTNIFKVPQFREAYRYQSHTFMDKEVCRPTQAANLLAWQWYKDLNRKQHGFNCLNSDLAELLSATPHHIMHADSNKIKEIVNKLDKILE